MDTRDNKLLAFIVIISSVAVGMSSLYRIGVWYQRGGYELPIIYSISKMIFMINIDIYIFKKDAYLLLFAGLSLLMTIVLFILLYTSFTSSGLSHGVFQLLLYSMVFMLYTKDFFKSYKKHRRQKDTKSKDN